MRLPTILISLLTTTILFGQQKTIDDPKQTELIKNEFLTSFYRELTIDFQKIQRADLPIPYFVGDEFILTKPLRIGEIMNADSSISFDIDKGSLIPAGHKLKLLSKKGSVYSIRTTDQEGNDERTNIISENVLKSYLDPHYNSIKGQFFDDYKNIIDTLTKRISKKYNLTPDQVIGIIDSHVAFKKK
jgi:hypothetical protein